MTKWAYSSAQGLFGTLQSTDLIRHVSRLQEKVCTTTSTDAEKVFNKIQHPFMIKSLNKLEKKGSFLNLIKNICVKTLRLTSH